MAQLLHLCLHSSQTWSKSGHKSVGKHGISRQLLSTGLKWLNLILWITTSFHMTKSNYINFKVKSFRKHKHAYHLM